MKELIEDAVALWEECPAGVPALGRAFNTSEQEAREAELARFIESIEGELHRPPRTRAERQQARERIGAAFGGFAKAGLELGDEHLQLLFGGGFAGVGTHLARRAREFDPRVATADILQASRNAWTGCGLQMLLGRTMGLTPAIFAYSMLYPYTDNYMDDPKVSREAKLGFSARFRERLAGRAARAANAREEAIWRLVGVIEGEYDRARWPGVFTSLLGIHAAQEESLRARDGAQLRELSFAKGGASVLADGYLAAGALTVEQAEFVFSWGVLLQLADDLQDVREDLRDGAATLFTEAAGRGPLDELTSRTLQFGERVMGRMRAVVGPGCGVLGELIESSARSLVVRSAGDAGELYTLGYLAELEVHSPFRFGFLDQRRRQLERHKGMLGRLFEAFLEAEEDEGVFPLLPSSLMPRF